MGFIFPGHIPRSLKDIIRHLVSIIQEHGIFLWKYSIWEAIPLQPFTRFHVDWILYNTHNRNSSQNGETVFDLMPRFISIADVRSGNYSSDHFPVVALFEINSKTN